MHSFAGAFLLLVTTFIWGTAFLAQKYGADHLGAASFTVLRNVLGGFFLLALLAIRAAARSCRADGQRGTGGLPGMPGLLLHGPLEDVDAKDIASVTEAFSLLVQTGRSAEAEALLAKAAPRDDTARAWILSHKSHLAFLQ